MEPTREEIRDILLRQGFSAETVENILDGRIEKTSVLAENDPVLRRERGEIFEQLDTAQEALNELEKEVMAADAEDEDDPNGVGAAIVAAEAAGVDGVLAGQPPLEASFNQEQCPVCNNEKAKKDDAIEASQKAEMILVLRDIVGRFKRETDSRLTALSNRVTAQINTIVAASNDLTVTKHDLDLSLIRFEEDLKDAFGIKDTLDPKWAGNAMFLEDEEGEPLDMFDAPAPGTDAVFDKLSADVDAVLGENDPTDVESLAQTDQRPFKAGDPAYN